MKNTGMLTRKFSLVVVVVLIGLQGLASSKDDEEKRRVIEKKYDVRPSLELVIENQFGNIHVENWDKNQIDVRVEIIARGRNADRALKILEKIEVDITESSDIIQFVTEISSGLNAKGDHESFEINYRVRMNPKNPIHFENKFGNIYLSDRTGPSKLSVEYGNLKAENMIGECELELSFGNAEIGDMSEAEMEIQYSNITIGNIIYLEMEQKFSNLDLQKVERLELETKYGEVIIGELTTGEIEGHFSSFKIRTLYDHLVFEANYVSDFEIGRLDKNFSLLDLSGQFSGYKVTLGEGLSANIEAEFSYAELNYSGVQIDFNYKDFDGNKKEYRGKINGGSPNRMIKVNSSYGSLRLTQ